MKKLISILLILIFTFAFSACGADAAAIEDHEWKMRAVMSNNIEVVQNEDELVVAVGEEDALYPDAKIVDLTLAAKDGELTITDATNGKTYSGTYKVQQKTPEGTAYEVTIDGEAGYAELSPAEYYDGSELPTLPINLSDYSLYFIPAK